MKKIYFIILMTIPFLFSCKNEKKTNSNATTFYVNELSFNMIPIDGSNFSIGETEVTIGLWKSIMGTNPGYFNGDEKPVERVSWNDVQVFIEKLNAITGKTFRLPTEAEWEFAAKGGSASKGFKYSGSDDLNDVGWYYDNGDERTHPVKEKKANELGIYDMSGNVAEWCADTTSDGGRSYRGGGWYSMAKGCQTDKKNSYDPSMAYNYLGFRILLDNQK